jgi:predicted nucleotidyltransferase
MTASGKFIVRTSESWHRKLSAAAAKNHLSFNRFCQLIMEKGFEAYHQNADQQRLQRVLEKVKKVFGSRLLGVVLFGSVAKGEENDQSDIDLLIVMNHKIKLERSLYRLWDDQIDDQKIPELSPHFVHVPQEGTRPGSLWLEVVMKNQILWQQGRSIDRVLEDVTGWISRDDVQLKSYQGQPSWVWRDSAE